MNPRVARLGFSLALLVAPLAAQAKIKLGPLLQEHGIVQRDLPIVICGEAEPGTAVEVLLAAHRVTANVGQDGRFRAVLPPLPAGGPHTLEVGGAGESVLVKDVLVGEVWLCSGQSNMEYPMKAFPSEAQAIDKSADDGLRLFTVGRATALEPRAACAGGWSAAKPANVREFSAVAYHFGRELHEKLGVPVGLVLSSWGGTRAEAWTRREALEQQVALAPIVEAWNGLAAAYPAAQAQHDEALAAWQEASAAAEKNGAKAPEKPKAPTAPDSQHAPGVLWNAMIAPLVPFTFRGVIWYQGESNADRAEQYATLFPAMIRDWRDAFGQGDVPFLFVQLAAWAPGKTWAELRDAQTRTLAAVRGTGMAVAIDLGDAKDIHPARKAEVGRRLALEARRVAYGERDLVAHGPLLQGARIEGARVRIAFESAAGLHARDAALRGFTIAGQDRRFQPAQAAIDGETVVVWSDAVPVPVAVRYGWEPNPDLDLTNGAELPASPFRTDDWPGETVGKLRPF